MGVLPRDDRRVHVLAHGLLGDHDLRHVRAARDVVHDRQQHLFQDRPQPARTRAAQDRLVGHRLQRRVRELQLHAVHLEQPLVLLDQGVARLGEDLHQRRLVQVRHAGHRGQPADELRDQPELDQVLGQHLGEVVHRLDLGLRAQLRAEADAGLAHPVLDDLVQPGERAGHDEQHVRRVDLDELLVRVLAAALRGNAGGGALQDLQQRLLHALTGDVAGDRRVLALARDLVDLVDVDDAGLGALDVVVGGLDELQQDVLDVLADVAGLGQRRGVRDRERDVEHLRQRLRQVGLAAAGRAQHQDVRLGELDVLLAVLRLASALPHLDALVVVVHRDRQVALRRVLPDDVLVQELVDLRRLRQLVELDLAGLGQFLLDDLVAEIDALIADVHAGAGDEFLHLLLALPAEGALQQVAAVTDTCHDR